MTKTSTTRGAAKKVAVSAQKARTPKASGAKPGAGPLSNKELLDLARGVVAKRLHGTARVVRPAPARGLSRAAAAGGLDAEVARLVGTTLPAEDASDASVEFVAETPLGKRHTVVHVRGNKITRVVTRASR